MNDKTPALPEPQPLDEVYDTMMVVEMNPCGAWQAIQTLSAQLKHFGDLHEREYREALDRADRVERMWRSHVRRTLAAESRATTAEAALATAEAERDAAHNEALEKAAEVVRALLPFEANTGDRQRFTRADIETYRKGALRLAIQDIKAVKETPNAE